MNCPRCATPMTEETLEGHLGRPLVIDLCSTCQSFWFDDRESLRLSPASTLRLFRLIGEAAPSETPPGSAEPTCPRCQAPLRLTKDLQRATRFEYLKCPAGHGRLTTFFNFLREKDFIRPLSAEQLAELRRNVEILNCSNCGGSINLATHSTCPHCGSALSMLDSRQAAALVMQLQQADRGRATGVDPAMPLELERARRESHAAFDALQQQESWFHDVSRSGLVGAGLVSLGRWLTRQM